MNRILVTGGAGFIGSHLTDQLAKDDVTKIVVVDNFDPYYDPSRKRKNIQSALKKKNVVLIEGDIRDSDFMDSVFRDHNIETVVHLAARAGVRASIDEPLVYQSVNIRGTLTLLELARKYDVRQFVFSSSSSVYGADSAHPFREDAACARPTSPYAATKRACELLCYTYSSIYELPIIALRFFTVYGPRQRPEMAIHKFFRLVTGGRKIPIFGLGKLVRDYTYIDDLIAGITAAIHIQTKRFDIVNLGTTHTLTINDLVDKIEQITGEQAKRKYLPEQLGDLRSTQADISHARDLLNYNPKVTIEEGLEKFWDWYQSEL
ncbi:MAG: epimerase [Candidatus Cloacimonetes bacterium 4572_55]|nr:MAG: epimerase [Candidatus Cloacimonetes bacterium 4572_55]